jgi:L-ascorbate metabolism protein UlaG (beta-lactamase superfamily)
MRIQQIRNSTLKIEYSDWVLLTDPALSAKHSIESFIGNSPNLTVDLPCAPVNVINGVDAVIISHLHIDHFDKAAQDLLPKHIPLFCQPCDEKKIKQFGFESITPIDHSTRWNNIQITRTSGLHGKGEWGKRMGNVSGFVFEVENEPTVYWVGDSIWCDMVEQVINEFHPDIIITHSCGATFADGDPIIMDAVQTIELCKAVPNAIVFATHMEAVDHATVSRTDLRSLAEKSGINISQLCIPADGEVITFNKKSPTSMQWWGRDRARHFF